MIVVDKPFGDESAQPPEADNGAIATYILGGVVLVLLKYLFSSVKRRRAGLHRKR